MPDVAPEPFSGTDRFAVTRRIGHGSMGVVYEAQDLARQMTVAIKTIRGGDANALYRFKREFRSLSNITHRNLAMLYELFADATPWFFTMELVNGVTFLEYVRRSASVDYARLSAALTELIAGLTALHSRNKLHRDIKPSNILVEPSGRRRRARLRSRRRISKRPRLGRFPNMTCSARSHTWRRNRLQATRSPRPRTGTASGLSCFRP